MKDKVWVQFDRPPEKTFSEYIDFIEERIPKFLSKLGQYGVSRCYMHIDQAFDYYMGNDTKVDTTYDVEDNTLTISANGNAICFLEFGAGVYYNGNGSNYPYPKPSEIAGIGEYGKGRGKQEWWVFKTDDGKKEWTHGNPAMMPMQHTLSDIRASIQELAREVFV